MVDKLEGIYRPFYFISVVIGKSPKDETRSEDFRRMLLSKGSVYKSIRRF